MNILGIFCFWLIRKFIKKLENASKSLGLLSSSCHDYIGLIPFR